MKSDLYFSKPLMNAAGTLGFAPDSKGPVDLSAFGAFVTNPISRGPRKPAGGTRFIPYPGGFLLHSGLPNPGLNAAIQCYGERWARSSLPVILHLLARGAGELAGMVEHFESVDGVMGIEIGLSPDVTPTEIRQMVQAALGELPIIVRLNLDAGENVLQAVVEAGASAISLGPPRGTLLDRDGNLVSGRIYGRAVFPLALQWVEKCSGLGMPIIGAGGVYQASEAEAMLKAGAAAVQVDALLWHVDSYSFFTSIKKSETFSIPALD